jgi:hypothetical protein
VTSSELKMQNARSRQSFIEKLTAANSPSLTPQQKSDAFLVTIAAGVIDAGFSLSEQVCELREAVDRLTNSLPKSQPQGPATGPESEVAR